MNLTGWYEEREPNHINTMADWRNDIVISGDIGTARDPALDGYLLHAWCPAGSCRFVYNERDYTFGAGDCMIMTRRGERLRDIQPEPGFVVQIVYVTQAFVDVCTPQSNYGSRGGMSLFANPVMHLTPEQQQVCALNFDYIQRRLQLPHHHFHRDAMINAVQCMIIDFFDFHAELYGNVRVTSTQGKLMDSFLALLDQGHYRRHRDVGWYAAELCVTPKYLSEVCRRVSGRSASHWITRYASLDISRILRNHALTLNEVAEEFGFSSVNYFTRYVQKTLGFPPSAFRQ